VTLFQRRPFALTPAGEKLYEFIRPFFSNLDRIAAEFQGGQARHFRIGASTIILRDHLPRLLQAVHKQFPRLKVSLREGYPAQLAEMLSRDEVDLVITLVERRALKGFHTLVLLELPLVLLVEKSSPLQSAEDLWQRDRIDDSLICLPAHEQITRSFQERLAELGVEWFPTVEASSVDLVEAYVAGGLGIGLTVAQPKRTLSPNVRALPLKDFPPAIIGALWRGKTTPLQTAFLEVAKTRARELA